MGQLLLERLAIGHVHHRAKHPDRRVFTVVNDVTAIDDKSVGSVASPKPVLVRPIVFPALDVPMNVVIYPLSVVGMQPLGPGGHVPSDLVAGVTKQLLETLVPPQFVGRKVPVTDRVAGCTRYQVESLLAEP